MTEYLRYHLKNTEPIRIADDSVSQSGQTSSLKYIAGSTIRGAVITSLAKYPDFEKIKRVLFSDGVRFLNAYPEENGIELIPSPKGFYEGKAQVKSLKNVMFESELDGWKRAGLGEFCYIEDGTVYYYSVDTGSDLKIKFNLENTNEKREVFRNDYMSAGYDFVGYIVIEDDSVKELIKEALGDELLLGNARSSGRGKCRLLSKEFVPYESTPFSQNSPSGALEKSCYMLLYTDTIMRARTGEYAGLNLKVLEKKLGISKLRVEHCATSTKMIHGYNRKLGIKLPSVPMYEKGSVFEMIYEGALTAEKMREVMESGIGVRKNEGFGQVIFLKEYKQIKKKQQVTQEQEDKKAGKTLDDQQGIIRDYGADDTLQIAAKNYYRRLLKMAMEKKITEGMEKGALSNSQIGRLESLITANKYNTEKAKKTIDDYFKHTKEKEEKQKAQKESASVKPLFDFVREVLDSSYAEYVGVKNQIIMGIPVGELLSVQELDRMKLEYLTELIRYDNRKESRI